MGAAIMTVELMLTLRVLALCELLTKPPYSYELVLTIHCYFRWELNRKEEMLFIRLVWPLIWRLQGLARFLIIQLFGKWIDQWIQG